MSYHRNGYGSSYGNSSLRRPYSAVYSTSPSSSMYPLSSSTSLSSSSFSPSLSYRTSTYSPSYLSSSPSASLSPSYLRRPSYGSSSALSKIKSGYGDSADNLSTSATAAAAAVRRQSGGSYRPLPRPDIDSPPSLRKSSFTRSLGNLISRDDDNENSTSGHDLNLPDYKKLYEEELSLREMDEAALISELSCQIELRQKLIQLLNQLEPLQDDLDDVSEMCTLLEHFQIVQKENEQLKQQQKAPRSSRYPTGRF